MKRQEWFEKKHVFTYGLLERLEEPIPSVSIEDWKQDMHMVIRMAIDALPDLECQVMNFIYVKDTPPTETAKLMSVTVQWVNRIRHRAIEKLKIEVAEQTSLLGILIDQDKVTISDRA